jgi:hypothetical protein
MTKILWLVAVIGYSLFALGLLLLSPLGDLLPVEVWMFLHGQPLGEGQYIVAVPKEVNRKLEFSFIAVGLLMVVVSRILRRSQ